MRLELAMKEYQGIYETVELHFIDNHGIWISKVIFDDLWTYCDEIFVQDVEVFISVIAIEELHNFCDFKIFFIESIYCKLLSELEKIIEIGRHLWLRQENFTVRDALEIASDFMETKSIGFLIF